MKTIQDHYFQKAKKEGYASRAAYKLQEINQKYHILKKGFHVLDLGCSPGAWLQYTASHVGPSGQVIGVDLKPVSITLPQWVETRQADLCQINWKEEMNEKFHVVLSDVAPQTTGIKSLDAQRSYNLASQAFEIACLTLRNHGHFLVKVFQNEHLNDLRAKLKQHFNQVKTCKPQSSRKESVEIFLFASHFSLH